HLIDEDSRTAAIKNTYSGSAGIFKAAIDIYMHELIARTEIEHKAQLRCWAGTAGAVIYDESTISNCENIDSVVNLRDYNWDFQSFWRSQLMAERRKKVKDGCHCTHESNCYYPSLPFNPKHLVQIKRLEKEMRATRKEIQLKPQTA